MKKSSFLTAPAIALGVSVLCAPQVLAAGYTLSQSNINAAASEAGVNKYGIFCDDVSKDFCTLLSEGDWIQDGDIDLTTVEIDGNPIQGLVLQNNVNITNPNGGTFTGNINVGDAEVTLTDLNMTGDLTIQGERAANITLTNSNVTGGVNVSNASADVTINSGAYTGGGAGAALNVNNSKTVTINDGTFTAGSASAAYLWGGDITIKGGTFTSEGDNGIEVFGINSLKISGGTFTGPANGLSVWGPAAAGKVSLSGGTFTGTSEEGKAIIVNEATDTTLISNMLASGYHFTNDTVETISGLGGGTYIAKTTKVLRDGESESEKTEQTSKKSSKTSKSALKAPDTGAPTAEVNASDNSIIAVLTALITTIFGAIILKKNSKRS